MIRLLNWVRSFCKHKINSSSEMFPRDKISESSRIDNSPDSGKQDNIHLSPTPDTFRSQASSERVFNKSNSEIFYEINKKIEDNEEIKNYKEDYEKIKNRIESNSIYTNQFENHALSLSEKIITPKSELLSLKDKSSPKNSDYVSIREIPLVNSTYVLKNPLNLNDKVDELEINEKMRDEKIKELVFQNTAKENLEIQIHKEDQPIIAKNRSIKKLLKKQKTMPIHREKGLKKLNDAIDKTQACIFCQLPIDENDISFSLLCKHRSCFICIYNKLQDVIGAGENQLLLCTCGAVIYIYLLAEDIELEYIDLYTEMISSISKIDASVKCCCPYDLYISKKSTINENNLCENCKNHFCQKCGLAHINQTCFENYNETFIKEIKEKLPKCHECKENPLEMKLDCECQLCLKCCKNMIRNFLYNEDPMEDPVCMKHKIIIPRMYIYQAFEGRNNYIKEQEKAIDFMILSPKFDCEICFVQFSINQSITLDCNHRFCSNCIKLYLNTLMKESSFANKIGCPKCNTPIFYETIKSNSDPDIFERYLKFTVMVFQPEDKVEVMKWCINCDFGCKIPIDEENFKCPNCESEYCPKCNKKHYMSKCQDARSSKTVDELKTSLGENEEFFTNFMRDFIKCPNCGEAIQKVAGCNFLTCTWPRCKEIRFCAICKKILTKYQHYSHFKISGPFGGTCNTTDGINEG